MGLYKRKGERHWRASFVDGEGIHRDRSTKSANRTEAQRWLDQQRHERWRVRELGQRPRRTWRQAVALYLDESTRRRDLEGRRDKLRYLDPLLGVLYLETINADVIRGVKARFKGEKERAPGTVNRLLAVVSAVLHKAHEHDWVAGVPAIPYEAEPKRRVRYLTREEAERLLTELPDHLRDIAQFALLTGLRKANVAALAWEQVDLERGVMWVYADQAKAGKTISTPLNEEAVALLRRQRGRHERAVFTYEGQPIKEPAGAAWEKALARAGIEEFRFHDLRHTWATWHVQAGAPLLVLKELGGWASLAMVERYAHVAQSMSAQYAAKLTVRPTLREVA